jgi:hypothetical protein
VLFDPAGSWRRLSKLRVTTRSDAAPLVDEQAFGGAGALVDRQDQRRGHWSGPEFESRGDNAGAVKSEMIE